MSENDSNNSFDFQSSGLLLYVHNRRKPLFIITILGFVFSFIISYFLKPEYESTVVLFPATSSSVSQSLLTDNTAKKEILKFGEQEDVEQILQVLLSDEIRDRIIKKFNLMKHYEIDNNDSYPQTKLFKKYKENVTFTRTEFMSIQIKVTDNNAQFAANIANEIANQLDTVMNQIQNERAIQALKIVEKEYFDHLKFVNSIQDSLKKIREKGVVDYESQSEVYNDAYAKAIADGKLKGAELLQEKIKIIAEYGGAYVSLRELLEYEIKKSSILESKYTEAKVDVEQKLPHKYIVSKAIKAEKKSFPIIWLIVSVSTVSTFALALLLLIIFDNLKKKRFF
jgi:capsular polysaccharide biosynthesis protein